MGVFRKEDVNMAEKIAVYPGTFDPMTMGHLDLIRRAAALYPRLVVAVAATSVKTGAMFDAESRMAMIREDVKKAGLGNAFPFQDPDQFGDASAGNFPAQVDSFFH